MPSSVWYQKTPSSVIPDSHCQHLNHLENHTGDFSLISCLVILYPPDWIKTMRSQNEFCTNPITDLVPKARSTLSNSMSNRRAAVRQVPEKESTIVVAPDDCCASTSLITATCLCNTCNEIFNLSNWSESIFQGSPRNILFQHLSQNQEHSRFFNKSAHSDFSMWIQTSHKHFIWGRNFSDP